MIHEARQVLFRLCPTLMLIAVPMSAQSPAAPAPHRVIIRAGRVLDVKTGKTLTNQAIVIEGDKIVSVGPAADAKPDAGAPRPSICPMPPCSPA